MAQVWEGMPCAICQEPINLKVSFFATSGVFLPYSDPLSCCCDAAMHWECYAAWPHRQRFAKSYVDMWVEWEKANEYWAKVYLDDLAFVSVNPSASVGGVQIWLFKTGSCITVTLADWNERVMGKKPLSIAHPIVEEALSEALPMIRMSLPTAQTLLAAADWAGKERLHQEHLCNAVLSEQQREESLAPYNERCRKLQEQIARSGFTCPHCGRRSTNVRYRDKSPTGKSYLVCLQCGRSLGPDDVEVRNLSSSCE